MTTIDTGLPAAPPLPDGLPLHWQIQSRRDLVPALFIDALVRRDLRHLREVAISAGEDAPGMLGAVGEPPLLVVRDDFGETAVFELDGGLVQASVSPGFGFAVVAASTPEEAEALAARVSGLFGKRIPPEDEIAITFWTAGTHGARAVRRDITAQCWSEVSANYERETALAIGQLITARVPSAGRLILWHGPPGTGKTSALRALARVWSDWCATHFVTDPEVFLGSGTAYMLDVLTADPARRDSPGVKWKMVVLEDAGELLAADAHERTGQALSRLLNVTDGLLGQGMNVIVMVTTNEPLGALHPAVTRPGRCWMSIDFQPLSVTEADAWLASHDSGERVTQPTTLAELYGVLRGREPMARRPFGFGRAGCPREDQSS